jgi:hypothetical protein
MRRYISRKQITQPTHVNRDILIKYNPFRHLLNNNFFNVGISILNNLNLKVNSK